MKRYKTDSILLGLAVLFGGLTILPMPVSAGEASQEPQAGEPKSNITPGFKLIDGDIQVPEGWFDPLVQMAYNTFLWPNESVPYEFDANVSAANQTNMLNAMAQWTAICGVQFVSLSSESNYVHIQNSTGNNSPVGMVGGQQIINISSWTSTFIIAHELGHCLGLYHEHQRPDRDTFITVTTSNVQGGTNGQIYLNNFPTIGAAHGYGRYDFDSVMHYGRCAFSVCCPAGTFCNCASNCETMTVLGDNFAPWNNVIGHLSHLSTLDKLIMRLLYGYSTDRHLDITYSGTSQGTFIQPWNMSFSSALQSTPANGTLFIQPGNYSAIGSYNVPRTVRAPIGLVRLGT